jgi:hypothetical protein
VSDERSLFGLPPWNGEWKSTPLTRESVLRGAEALKEAWRKQRENPSPSVVYQSQANLQQLGDDLEAEGDAWPARVHRDESGRVTLIEW